MAFLANENSSCAVAVGWCWLSWLLPALLRHNGYGVMTQGAGGYDPSICESNGERAFSKGLSLNIFFKTIWERL